MAGTVLTTPPGFKVRGDNWFHEGWIHAHIGLPMRDFSGGYNGRIVRDVDCDAYREGYETAIETSPDRRVAAMPRIMADGHVIVEDLL